MEGGLSAWKWVDLSGPVGQKWVDFRDPPVVRTVKFLEEGQSFRTCGLEGRFKCLEVGRYSGIPWSDGRLIAWNWVNLPGPAV